jgi:hypothetical protein
MPQPELPSQTVRNVISGMIAFHFSLLVLMLAGNVSSSALQNALRTGFSGYSELLRIDPDFTPLYLTHAQLSDTAHVIEITEDPTGKTGWQVLRPTRSGTASRHRMLRLGRLLSVYVEIENQTGSAEIARSLAEYAFHRQDLAIRRIRLRRHLLQDSAELRQTEHEIRDADDPAFYRIVFEADVLVKENGEALINKIDSQMETAAPAPNGEPAPDAPQAGMGTLP